MDVEYQPPSSSEKFQYRSQQENQDLIGMENTSPYTSEKMHYRSQDEEKKLADAEGTSQDTSDVPEDEVLWKFPCGLFEDGKHWKKKDWAAAVICTTVAIVCVVGCIGLAGKSSGGGGSNRTVIYTGSSSRPDDKAQEECNKCMDACCWDGCLVPCCKPLGCIIPTVQQMRRRSKHAAVKGALKKSGCC